jgi:multiple sugar transport system permease protein
LAVGVVIVIFPFVWVILSSFKSSADVYSYPPKWLPSEFKWDNFKKVFTYIPFGLYYLNSIITTVVLTGAQIAISILAAYALAKLSFPFKEKVYLVIISTMLMPTIVTLIPVFLIVSELGWINTYTGLIVPEIFGAFAIILLRQFFMQVPNELVDAANIDGCSYIRVLLNVIIPSTIPAIFTATLFSFLNHWSSYLWPLIVINSTNMRTLPIGLKYLVDESSSEYQVMMAAALMAIVPVLIMYMLTEKQFIKSITLTGLKG